MCKFIDAYYHELKHEGIEGTQPLTKYHKTWGFTEYLDDHYDVKYECLLW